LTQGFTRLQYGQLIGFVTGVINTPQVVNQILCQFPFACTITNLRAYQDVGTGSTVNARRNGSLKILSSDLTLISAATWLDGGAVQNQSCASGDKIEIMVTGVSGSPNQIAIQLNFTIP
jgi:hypothetical protein